MITDYESFIAGVQLGRRLRIWDATRIVQPPLPSDMYIITEDDMQIITEIYPSGLTNYASNVWYPYSQYADRYESSPLVSTGYSARLRNRDDSTISFNYILAAFPEDENVAIYLTLLAESSAAINNKRFVLEKLNADGTETVLQYFYISPGVAHRIKDDLWMCFLTASPPYCLYRPDDAQMFYGSLEDLYAYLAEQYYMLTE